MIFILINLMGLHISPDPRGIAYIHSCAVLPSIITYLPMEQLQGGVVELFASGSC